MNMKKSYDEVKEYFESLGYELLSEEYIGTFEKLLVEDKEKYRYWLSLNEIRKSIRNNSNWIPNILNF
jgi:hypothetical protein